METSKATARPASETDNAICVPELLPEKTEEERRTKFPGANRGAENGETAGARFRGNDRARHRRQHTFGRGVVKTEEKQAEQNGGEVAGLRREQPNINKRDAHVAGKENRFAAVTISELAEWNCEQHVESRRHDIEKREEAERQVATALQKQIEKPVAHGHGGKKQTDRD